MTNDLVSYLEQSPQDRGRAAIVMCIALLAAASASTSLVFACAAPFAAFAALAATVLPLRQALVAVVTSWLVNQAIGFGLLGYPHAIDTAMWGLAIVAGAAFSTLVVSFAWRYRARFGGIAFYPLVLTASYAAYELTLFAAIPILGGGGSEAFSATVVGELAFLNAVWMLGLIVVYELGHRILVARGRDVLGRRGSPT